MDWAKALTVVAAFFAGGLAGSIFTWYVNLPATTIVAYSISTTAIAADPTVRGTVPGLRLQIGKEEVPALYTHAVEFSIPGGPHIERFEVALVGAGSGGKTVRTFGVSTFPPSPLHELACGQLGAESVRCMMGPVGGNNRGPFRVIWATSQAAPPKIVTAAKGVDLLALVDYAARAERWKQIGGWIISVGLTALIALAATFLAVLQRNVQQRARIAKAQADTRAIASAVSIYGAATGTMPNSLQDLTSPTRNMRGERSGPFLRAIPEPPRGWTPYTYRAEPNGIFSVESSGDGTVVRIP